MLCGSSAVFPRTPPVGVADDLFASPPRSPTTSHILSPLSACCDSDVVIWLPCYTPGSTISPPSLPSAQRSLLVSASGSILSPLLSSALYCKGSVPNSLSHDLFKLQPLISDPDLLLVRARTDPTVQLSGFFLTDLDV